MDFTGAGSALITGAGGLLSNFATGLFNANQSKINRNFQREMYERQYKDSIDFWNMQNQYALPSAQVQRLRDANLNPLLMYSQGGMQGMSSSAPQLPSQPHGAQASAAFSNPLEMAQYALLDAQKEKLVAEKDKIRSEFDWQEIENRFSRETLEVRKALQIGNYDYIKASVNKLYRDMVNNAEITRQQVLTMRQARLYEAKRFDIDSNFMGQTLDQKWRGLELEQERNNQAWRALAIDARRLFNETRMTNQQLGLLRWSLLKDKAMFLPQFEGLSLDNKLKRWDTHLRKATLTEKQIGIWNGVLKNQYLKNYGTEQVEGGHLTKDLTKFSFSLDNQFNLAQPMFQDVFVIP